MLTLIWLLTAMCRAHMYLKTTLLRKYFTTLSTCVLWKVGILVVYNKTFLGRRYPLCTFGHAAAPHAIYYSERV